MIAGIGIDLVKIERVAGLFKKFGERLEKKVLTSKERKMLSEKFSKIESLAARIAAKEAVIKALNAKNRIPLIDIEVLGAGPLEVRLKRRAASRLAEIKGKNVFVSIAHESNLAIAVAIAEG